MTKPVIFTQRVLDTSIQASCKRLSLLSDCKGLALMPDIHLADNACVGTVLATKKRLYPSVIGGDIGCGIRVLKFNCPANTINQTIGDKLVKQLQRLIPQNQHKDAIPWTANPLKMSCAKLRKIFHAIAGVQLGTIGGGNHFVELQKDAQDQSLWAMIHTGSRGLGQAISQHHQHIAKQFNSLDQGLPWLSAQSPFGQDFLKDLHLARAYARLNRRVIASALSFVLSETVDAQAKTQWDTDHNHIKYENNLWIHRKGAAPAHKGQMVAIPGSMATFSIHAVGRGNLQAFASSPHGAGRRLTRHQATSQTTTEQMRNQLSGIYHAKTLYRKAKDEGSHAYRPLNDVLKEARPLVHAIRQLTPILIHKG